MYQVDGKAKAKPCLLLSAQYPFYMACTDSVPWVFTYLPFPL